MKIDYIIPSGICSESGESVGTRNKVEKLSLLINDLSLFLPSKGTNIESISYPFKLVKIPGTSHKLGRFIYQLSLLAFLFVRYMRKRNHPNLLFVRHHILNFGFLLPALLFHIPFFLDTHSDIIEEILIILGQKSDLIPKFCIRAFRKYEGFIFRKASGIIVNHPALKRFFAEIYCLSTENLQVISNGADIDNFKQFHILEARKSLNLELNKKRLIFVGTITIWHGLDYVIQCLPFLEKLRKDFILDIIGTGREYSNIIEMAKSLGVEKYVNFVGQIPLNMVPQWINSADICLLPAKMVRKHPGSPIKMFDYMACGKPILAADVEGYGDFVENNKLGISVDYTKPRELAQAIDNMLNSNLDIYKENNRLLAETQFSWLCQAERIKEFFLIRLRTG